ncbi:DNA (cytosine-5)-methyltransferase 1 [Phenylobacterium haematophilum]|uniref:DNA (cytosine-5-)-methyltransferase n=1 Tax=Phenylobacterium haematophilum TaxID=98513 RepID=A0A840A101_9CAUL|nr:DNA cytosine methyltransferase [Phenylobacterium haematophilum]MBB3892595.1 DNA (cytosine-5)-methyltransferase 1 [Phenylobacterium haematophilum]
MSRVLSFYEFFAGGGMARLGLGPAWACAFANDFDPLKAATYRANFADADAHFHQGDVWAIDPAALPPHADLAWASSPCQDFSLAGARAGLAGGRSSAFFGFWRLVQALGDAAPRAIVIENVTGLLSSHGGADFTALCQALADQGYAFGALEIDAARFTPQSRPRVFVIATREPPAPSLSGDSPFHTRAVREAHARLPEDLTRRWIWWRGAAPAARNTDLAALLEPDAAVAWHGQDKTERLLALMAPPHLAKIEAARASGTRQVGAVFRRMRVEDGQRVQRAEVRFDGLAGCLRTPRGGSSRQTLVVVEHGEVRSRLVSPREGARLMGLPDSYALPRAATGALHVVGDGVVVPVVRWLAEQILEPLLDRRTAVAAE